MPMWASARVLMRTLRGGLDAEEAGQAGFVEHLRPGAVGEDHHFADEGVDGGVALASGYGDAAVGEQFDAAVVLHGAVGFVSAALFLPFYGEAVKPGEVVVMGEGVAALCAGFAVEVGFDVLDAQVVGDGDAFGFADGVGDLEVGVYVEIEAEGGRGAAGVEAECGDPSCRAAW